jgi:hypothetical protein
MQRDVTPREDRLNALRKTAWQRPFGKGLS